MHTTAVVLALALVATTAQAQNSTCTTIANKDRAGFDLSNVRGALDACQGYCTTTSGCATWTWSNYNGGTCWLKTYASSLVDKAGVYATDCVNSAASLICVDYKDIDFVGMDIGSKPAAAASSCCEICSTFSGCAAYAWNSYNGGTCWLKKSVGQVIATPGVVSSSLVNLWGPVCPFEYDTNFVGNDIGNKPAKCAGACCNLCKADKNCKAYSWSNYNGGTCWMKSGKGATTSAVGVISAALAGF